VYAPRRQLAVGFLISKALQDGSAEQTKMSKFAARFPSLFALATTAMAMLCLLWPMWLRVLSQTTQILLGSFTICLFAAAMLTHLGWWREAGFVRPRSWRILLPYVPVLLLVILAKASDVGKFGIRVTDPRLIILGVVVYGFGGLLEEAVFRGLVLRSLLPAGLVRAAIWSSVIFASAHLFNLTVGANLEATILQVIVAFLVGLVFTAPLLVTRNIWPLVVVHALNNLVGYLAVGGFLNTAATSTSPTLGEAISSVLPWLLLASYSLWLVVRHREIAQCMKDVPSDVTGSAACKGAQV
jgi:membrane protease YdiL (CAAX protease family)